MNFFSDSLLTLRGVYKYSKFLKKSQYFSENEIKDHQVRWLSSLLKHCQSIVWYSEKFREYNVNPYGDDPFVELKKLPILSKKDVMENHADFCIPGAKKDSLTFFTSGTTGEPLQVYTSKNQWIMEQGIIWRSWKWADYNFRDKIAIFRSYAPKEGEPKLKKDRLKNWVYFSVYNMTEGDLEEYFRFLDNWKPRYLRGYPSAINLLIQHAIDKGYDLPYVYAVLTASESFPEGLREKLASLDIPVFDHYGQAEISCMFHECEEHQGMHLDWEYGFVELELNQEDSLYSIISTNYHNYSMPLLRYDTGDVSEETWTTCKCKRSSKVLKRILGRKDDYLIASDGTKLPTVNLYTFFSKIPEVKRFQIIQEKKGEIQVRILVWEESFKDKDFNFHLSNTIKNELESKTQLLVEVMMTNDFIQSGGGKLPVLLQRLNK